MLGCRSVSEEADRDEGAEAAGGGEVGVRAALAAGIEC